MVKCQWCGHESEEGMWHACAARDDSEPRLDIGIPLFEIWPPVIDKGLTIEQMVETHPLGSKFAVPHSVWTHHQRGDICSCLTIPRDVLPANRREMRKLLSQRLQAFGDALMEEWEKANPDG